MVSLDAVRAERAAFLDVDAMRAETWRAVGRATCEKRENIVLDWIFWKTGEVSVRFTGHFFPRLGSLFMFTRPPVLSRLQTDPTGNDLLY